MNILEGQEIFLRPMTPADTDNIIKWRNTDFVRRNFIYQKPFTIQGHEEWTQTMIDTGKAVQFMICVKDTGKPVGSVYLRDINPEHKKAEYGVFIGEADALGKGYGTEAARLLTAYAFQNMGLHKVMLRVLAGNEQAKRSYEKAGFVQEAYLQDEVILEGRYRDVIYMAMIQSNESKASNGAARISGGTGMTKKISFVIPCYRSTATLPGVIEEIKDTMKKLSENNYEVILINDCSPDDTFGTIKRLCEENTNITGISLAKNFGQHSALMAGFRYAKGETIICLDDDGQTPADEVGKLLDGIEQGADVVYAKYIHKHHSGFRNFGSRINELMTRIMLGKPKDLQVSSYFAMRRFVLEEIIQYEYAYPYVIGLVLRTTKNIVNVEINHRDRLAGESGYTFGKLLNLWFNGFTAFSVKPLRIATVAGACTAGVGFLYGIYTIIKKIFINPPGLTTGFSALMSVLVFMCGMIMLMLGLVGEYMGRMYISMNHSPQYVIREIAGTEVSK